MADIARIRLMQFYSYELFAEAQRDLTAEQAAAKLQECSEEHYKGVS
jgi:galactose-1-phosphate uridylyltransferase